MITIKTTLDVTESEEILKETIEELINSVTNKDKKKLFSFIQSIEVERDRTRLNKYLYKEQEND